MDVSSFEGLENLILVAGHAVYVGRDVEHPETDAHWILQDFQAGEPPFYIEHIQRGIELAAQDPSSLLVLSGGQTRREAGQQSEAEGYRSLAEHFEWWAHPEVAGRTTTEEFARDSLENLLFSICRFKECVGRYPNGVTVVSWRFKKDRFDLHRKAIRFPASRYTFVGANQPEDLAGAERGEAKALEAFVKDPYGTDHELGGKRAERNPFRRSAPYPLSCPEAAEILSHQGAARFTGDLPWA